MTMTMSRTVRELALEKPGATRIFERLGIDYCCGGQKPLEDACAAANVSVEEVLAQLEQTSADGGPERDWQKESLTRLIEHINSTHHVFVRSESARILALLDKVCTVHGGNHAELLQVRQTFAGLTEELASHLMKEEQILFPYILGAEQGIAQPTCFGSVQNPIRMMMFEHDSAGTVLRELRRLTGDYTTPADACISYQTLYQALKGFETDLHQHIHLENNILFPRAVELEG